MLEFISNKDAYIGLMLYSIITICFIVLFYTIFFYKKIKNEKIEFGILFVMTILILYLIVSTFEPFKQTIVVEDSILKLNTDEYALYYTTNEYIVVSRETGLVTKTTDLDYMRYELCLNIEIYKYDVLHKLSNGFITISNEDTIAEVKCLYKEK